MLDAKNENNQAFLIYQDATGKEFVAYSDILRTTNAG